MKKKLDNTICNSSPIIGLAMLNLIPLLWEIFDQAIIPQAVYEEVVKSGENKLGKIEIERAVNEGKIHVYIVKDELFINRFLGKLHRGELEVIAAAKELDARYLLIDDRAARRLADTMMLDTLGLIGLLKIAKLSGKIDSMKFCLDQLIEQKYRISKKLYQEILTDVGEDE